MFTPRYELNMKLFTTISQIERLYGQIEALKIPQKLQLHLSRQNMIKSSYASNRIEGNPLTLPEVTNLLLDDRIPANRDEKEIVNYFDILNTIENYQTQPLDTDLTCQIHRRLLTGIDSTAGEIRNVQVVVGKYREEKGNVSLKVKHNPPHHQRSEIISDLDELFSWIAKNGEISGIIKAGLFHHQFVYIHPFEDGNGRVCRLLTALIFLRHGYYINKYFILDDYYDIDREQYSDSLHSADTGDKTTWLEYFTEGVKYSLQSALAKFKHAMTNLKAEERLTPREQEVLSLIIEKQQITSQDVVGSLKVTRQQAHNLLRNLLDKGMIDKKGSTKSSFYFLK